MAFRIGRKFAYHTYPEAKFSGLLGPFARNYSFSNPTDQTVAAAPGTPIPWSLIESGAPAGVNVPITPKETGVVQVSAAITMKNTGVTAANITVNLKIDGVTNGVPFDEEVSVPAAGAAQQYVTIPVLATVTVTKGATHNFELVLTSSDGTAAVFLVSATMSLQEMPAATG